MLDVRGRAELYGLLASVVGLVCLKVTLACGRVVYQWAARRRDRRLNPPPGRLVNVGGYRMHIYCP